MTQGKLRDLTGQRFGRLVVLDRGPTDGNGAQWWCRCDCGTTKLAKSKRLIQGNTRSCGCLLREANRHRFENPATMARLRDAMAQSWEDGKRRRAHEAKHGGKPARAAPPRPRRTRSEAASLDLAKAMGYAARRK